MNMTHPQARIRSLEVLDCKENQINLLFGEYDASSSQDW